MLRIYHPKPIVDSIVFYDFIPGQLSNCLNITKEIYNPEVKLGFRVFYNDHLSNEETIKLELHHTKDGVLNILEFTDTTQVHALGNPPFIEFDNSLIGSFNLGPADFDTTKFRAYAWFDEYFTEPEDHKASDDSLMLVYRVNKKPIIVHVIPFDSITTDGEVKITGSAYDTTGVVDELRIRINSGEEKFAVVAPSTPNYFNFSLTETLTEPINNLTFIAKDAVDFYPDGSLLSEEVTTRLNYLFWDTPDVFVPKDTNYRLIAQPPGGEFISELTNPVGVFNPFLVPAGNYDVDYKYTTANDSKTISEQIQILQQGSVTGNVSVCLNSYETYTINYPPPFKVDWKVNGGLITEFDIGTGAVEVKWVDNANVGNLIALIIPDNADDAYELARLVAINSKLAPPKAQVVRSKKVFFCSIDDAPYYQWKKDGLPVEGENKAWFYDPDHNPEAYYSVSVSYCEDCQPKPDCITDSYKIKGSETICEGCIIEQQVLITDLVEIAFEAEYPLVELKITPVNPFNIKLLLYNDGNSQSHFIEIRATSIPDVHTLLLKNLTVGNSYKVKLIMN